MEHYENVSLQDIIEVIDGVIHIEQWIDTMLTPDYQVSTFGRIKSTKRKKPFIKSLYIAPIGYTGCTFCVKGVKTRIMIHRVVAESFLPNIENKRTVNHKNGIKYDNRLFNLEWATYSENNIHAARVLKIKKSGGGKGKFGKESNVSKPVLCVNTNKEYETARQAQVDTGVSYKRISAICTGRANKSRNGLIFKFI